MLAWLRARARRSVSLATTKPPEGDSKLLVEIVRAGVDVDLTSTQTAAYGKTAARLNTIRAGGDPLARWVY
jgi:hypothetical protein